MEAWIGKQRLHEPYINSRLAQNPSALLLEAELAHMHSERENCILRTSMDAMCASSAFIFTHGEPK